MAIELGYTLYFLHVLKYQAYISKHFIMIISNHLKWYSLFLHLIVFSYNNMTIKFVENTFLDTPVLYISPSEQI